MKCDASGVHPDPEKVSSGSTQHGNTHQQEGTADAVPQLGSSSTGRLSNQPLRNHLCYVTSRRKTCPSCGRAITKPAWTESNKQSQKSLRWDTDNTGLHSRQTPASLGSRPEPASLIQDGQPTNYASAALSDAERHYSLPKTVGTDCRTPA